MRFLKRKIEQRHLFFCKLVQVVGTISLDDMHLENIWFSWSQSSNYQEKLRCHVCDIYTDGGKWKIGQCSVGPETAIKDRGTQ